MKMRWQALLLSGFLFQTSLLLHAANPANTLTIKDRFALGSGCRGKEGEPGKVRMNLIQDAKDPLLYKAEFDLSSYELDGEKPISKRAGFARECSLRLAAHPAKGFRIADLSMETELFIQKDKGAVARLKTRLLTGSGNLALWQQDYSKEDLVKEKRLPLTLTADKEGRDHLKNIPCEEPKILGADIQIANERDSFSPKVSVKMGQTSSRKATLTIRLAACHA